jgi:hypothetical protein
MIMKLPLSSIIVTDEGYQGHKHVVTHNVKSVDSENDVNFRGTDIVDVHHEYLAN